MAGTSRDDQYAFQHSDIPQDWAIDSEPMEVDITDEQALHQFIYDWVTVLKNVGGIVACVAVRREIAPSIFVTEGVKVRWDSYAPAERLERQEPRRKPRHEQAPQPEPEPSMRDEDDEAALESDDPDGLPDDHRRTAGAVLGG